MPITIPNTTATADYQSFGGGSLYGGGWILVYNNPVDVQLLHGEILGQSNEGETYTLPPGVTPIAMGGRPDFVTGFRVRAAGGTVPAVAPQFYAALWEPGLAGLTPSQPFPATVDSGGTFNFCFCGSQGETFEEGMLAIGATSDLLGWWRLGDSPPTFLDSNPYQPPANMTQNSIGAPLTPHVTGALGGNQDDGAVLFNGAGPAHPGDWLGASAARFDLASDMSMTFWVKPTLTASSFHSGIMGNAAGGALSTDGYGVFLSQPTNTLIWTRGDGSGFVKNVTFAIAAGAWYFVAATYNNASGAALYVNGQIVGTDASSFSLGGHGGSLRIGLLGEGTGSLDRYMGGAVDEAAIWGVALAQADILRLYQDGVRVFV